MSESDAIRRTVQLKIEQGLHIRACSNVLAIVEDFPGKVTISNGEKSADASSMFDLLLLAAMPGTDLVIEASGESAAEVVDRLDALFSTQSDETG